MREAEPTPSVRQTASRRVPSWFGASVALAVLAIVAVTRCAAPAGNSNSKPSSAGAELVPAHAGSSQARRQVPAPAAAPSAVDAGNGVKRRCVVAALGDSLTDPASHGGKYLDTLRRRCPQSQFDSYGKGGFMVNQIRRRFTRVFLGDAGTPAYTHLIVFGGINDILSDQTAHRTPTLVTSDLGAIYEEAHKQGMKVVAITITPWSGFRRWYNPSRSAATHEVNRWIREQLGKSVDHVVDAWPLLSCGDPEALCVRYGRPFTDGLHFGPQGHQKLGEALYDEAFSECG